MGPLEREWEENFRSGKTGETDRPQIGPSQPFANGTAMVYGFASTVN